MVNDYIVGVIKNYRLPISCFDTYVLLKNDYNYYYGACLFL